MDTHKRECEKCKKERTIASDSLCRECLRERGFRVCSICKEKRLALLDFYEGRAGCIDCRKQRSKSTTARACLKCSKYQPAKNFYSAHDHKCKSCYSLQNKTINRARRYETNKLWVAKNRQRHDAALARWRGQKAQWYRNVVVPLKAKPCTDCQVQYPNVVMEFDHLPGTNKKFNIAELSRRNAPQSTINAEIAKCEVVCVNCHRDRSHSRKPPTKNTGVMKYVNALREWVNTFKAKPCEGCHKEYKPWQMDFDHVDPATKAQSVSWLVRKRASRERILAEIAKCRLLCGNCHRIRTRV